MRNKSTTITLNLKQYRVLIGLIDNGLANGEYADAYLSEDEQKTLDQALKKIRKGHNKAESYENICSVEGCENDAIDPSGPSVCWEHSYSQ